MAHVPLLASVPPPFRAGVPHPPLLRRVARTAALVWVGLHAALLPLYPGVPHLLSAVVIVAACAAVVRVELRRRSEHLFHANLGISPRRAPALAAAGAGTLETLLQLGAHLLAGGP